MSFDSFRVFEGNRAGFERSRAVAGMEYGQERLTLLWGPAASGKSHLLWAIAETVRARPKRPALGLVQPHSFPESIRNLRRNPGPLESSGGALLLVDNVDQFKETASELEAVAALFLDHGHEVILTGRCPAADLKHFSAQFLARLKEHDVIQLQPAPSMPRVSPVNPGSALESGELERLRVECQALSEKCLLLQEEAASAMAEQARLQGLLSALREESTTPAADPALQGEDLRRVARQLKEMLAAALEQDQVLSGELESLVESVLALKSLPGPGPAVAHARAGFEKVSVETTELLSDLIESRRRIIEQKDQVQAENEETSRLLAGSRAEQARLAVLQAESEDRRSAAEEMISAERKQHALLQAEIEALRRDAAAQVASATMRAGELEHRIEGMKKSLDAALLIGDQAEGNILRAAGVLSSASESVNAFVAGLRALRKEQEKPPPAPETAAPQTDLFEDESGGGEGEAHDTHHGGGALVRNESFGGLKEVAARAFAEMPPPSVPESEPE